MKKFKKKESVRKYLEASTNRWDGTIELWYRDDDGKKYKETISGYCQNKWYFYIKREDYEKLNAVEGFISALENNEIDKLKLENPVTFELEENNIWVKVFVANNNVNEKYSSDKDDRIRLKRFLENEGIRIYEGDIHPHKRYCIDNNIQVANNFNILYYDIETDDSQHGIVIGRDNILSISGHDQNGKVYFWHKRHDDVDDEEFLKEFHDDIKYKFDVLVGWNSDSFDKPYIETRLKHHEVKVWQFSKNIAHIDLMQIFIKRFSNNSDLTSWRLDFIAEYFLGENKVDINGKGGGKILDLYNNDFEKFKEYNIKDSWLLYELNRKLGVVQQILLECQITGCFPSKFAVSELLDTYILRSVRHQDIHFPSIEYGHKQARCPKCNYNHSFETDELPYEYHCKFCSTTFQPEGGDDITGAFVVDPVVGRHDNVYTFDFKSLYPTIIITWNIGPDSFIEQDAAKILIDDGRADELIKSANGQYYWKGESSAVRTAIEKLLTLRVKFKKEMLASEPDSQEYDIANAKQRATKLLCNSMYGIMGYPRGRFYRKEIAESITLGGQMLSKMAREWFKTKGYDTLYGDTDSLFVKADENFEEKIPALLKELAEFYSTELKKEYNIDDHCIELEYEKYFRRLILVQKKRYAGHIIKQDGSTVDKVMVKGLEYVKRDTIPLAKNWQKELLDSLLDEDHSIEYYVDWVKNKSEIYFNGKFDVSEIIITKKLTKKPESYKTKTIHVKIAEEMMKREMECYTGMRIPYIVTKEKPLEAVHPEWYKPGDASATYYWDKQVYSICQRILEAVFPEHDWEQYTTKSAERRNKKLEQFKKWLKDPKKQTPKQKTKVHKAINECEFLSEKEKKELFSDCAPKRFKVKQIDIPIKQETKDEDRLQQKIRIRVPRLRIADARGRKRDADSSI